MKETITKIAAACRQLDQAIDLYFQEGDPIAIHTLACAAHQVIHDINQHRKGAELLFDSIVIKDEYRGLAKKYLNKHYNFFKHANNDPDPDGIIEFDPIGTEIFILTAIRGLLHLSIQLNIKHSAFLSFFCFHNPKLLTQKGLQLYVNNIPSDQLQHIRSLKRGDFIEAFLRLNSQGFI
ncbi:MAG TPA: hypothetical protein DD713_06630 [Nitrospiraceae bacterium]|nr:hypothetical protein [Nitrospiraceae bacterium]